MLTDTTKRYLIDLLNEERKFTLRRLKDSLEFVKNTDTVTAKYFVIKDSTDLLNIEMALVELNSLN